MPFSGVWWVKMEMISDRGCGGLPFLLNPNRYLPMMVRAREARPSQMTVVIATIRFGELGLDGKESYHARRLRRVSWVSKPDLVFVGAGHTQFPVVRIQQSEAS